MYNSTIFSPAAATHSLKENKIKNKRKSLMSAWSNNYIMLNCFSSWFKYEKKTKTCLSSESTMWKSQLLRFGRMWGMGPKAVLFFK